MVLGRSNIVGKPLALLLLREHCTVTVCHSQYQGPRGDRTRPADLLVAAVGRPALVTGAYLKEGAVVVDVGIHRIEDEATCRALYGDDAERLAAVRDKGSTLVGDVHPLEAPLARELAVPGPRRRRPADDRAPAPQHSRRRAPRRSRALIPTAVKATFSGILRVGLTGGIAAGKTTIASLLTQLGAGVIDADAVAHDVVSPSGPAYLDVVARFGPRILGADGRIDRTILGGVVFADPGALEALNAIVHPRVRAEAARRMADLESVGFKVAVLDAALLVETGMYRDLDRLVVVRCDRESQIRRLVQRGLTRREAELRLAAQAPIERKLAVADYVIDTSVPLDETRRQTERVWAELVLDCTRRG